MQYEAYATLALRTPQECIEYYREMAGLRADMNETMLRSLWAEGKSMNVDDAINFTLDGEDE